MNVDHVYQMGRRHEREEREIQARISGVRASPCCMRRARARYWRIARGYLACGLVLGIALGMVLGAASKVCQ